MNELDKRIREALAAEDEELVSDFDDEQSMFQMIADSFRGRHRWLVVLVWIAVIVYCGLMLFSALRFFAVDEIREMLLWGGLFGFSLLAVTACKIWYWMELNKNAVTREVKRVELQIARLAHSLRNLDETEE
jgi:hypothetical protein